MPVVLPAEITDRIIDFLHDDRETLCNCSVVCRDWVPSTRTHIFNKIYLSDTFRFVFLGLLRDAPYIGHYVRQLSFFYVPVTDWIKVINLCRNLSELRISQALETLEFDVFTTILSSLPVLKTLYLSYLPLELDKEPVLIPPNRLKLQVHTFSVHTVHYKYLTWSASQDLFPQLHTFEYRSNLIYGQRADNILALCTFWTKYGSNLVHVCLDNCTPASSQISDHLFDCLGLLCNLQSLVVDNLEIGRLESLDFWHVNDVPRFFSNITSRSLKDIFVGMKFFDGANRGKDFDEAFIGVWEKIGRTLATVQFSSVKTVGLGMDMSILQKKSLYFDPLLSLEQQGSLKLVWKSNGWTFPSGEEVDT